VTPNAGVEQLRSHSHIAAGLKEAVAKGTPKAISSVGRDGGFWNNLKVRIPLPGKLDQAAKPVRQLGQGAKVDAFEPSMNRAAEKAGGSGDKLDGMFGKFGGDRANKLC